MNIKTIIFCLFLVFPNMLFSDEKHEYSGFLENYPEFKRNRETGAAVWVNSQEKGFRVLRPYRKILLSPIEVWLDGDSYKGINPDVLKAMTDYFTLAIHKKLDFWYEFVNEPGPGVLHIRIAITNVGVKKPDRKWYGYIPVALVVEGGQKVARSAAGQTVDLIQASVEMEGLDSLTGERIIAVIDTRQSSRIKRDKNEPASWGPVKEIFDYWAERISLRMDQARDLH